VLNSRLVVVEKNHSAQLAIATNDASPAQIPSPWSGNAPLFQHRSRQSHAELFFKNFENE